METETKSATPTAVNIGVADAEDANHGRPVAILLHGRPTYVLSLDDLRRIVQQAWDQHGICADPFATETDWLDGVGDMPDQGPRVVEQLHGHVLHRTVDFTDAAHNTGVRA